MTNSDRPTAPDCRFASRLSKILAAAILLGTLAVAMTLLTSFRFSPDSNGDASFITRAQQGSAPGIKASISALGARERQQSFGEDLARYNIQPIWLSIENETDDELGFLSITMDPDYYSPHEVSYRFHGALSLRAPITALQKAEFAERNFRNIGRERNGFRLALGVL
jgi:hypothetical protein